MKVVGHSARRLLGNITGDISGRRGMIIDTTTAAT